MISGISGTGFAPPAQAKSTPLTENQSSKLTELLTKYDPKM
jgi:hypothetical protein